MATDKLLPNPPPPSWLSRDSPRTELPKLSDTPAPDARGLTGRYHGLRKQPSAVVDSRTGEVVRGKITGAPLKD